MCILKYVGFEGHKYHNQILFCVYLLSFIFKKKVFAQLHETETLIWLITSTLPSPGTDSHSPHSLYNNRRKITIPQGRE